jgi:hypothetical protein
MMNMRREKIRREVVDLTEEGIDGEVSKYLSLGPDFCESPRRVPYEKMICQTEKMCSVIRKARGVEGVDMVKVEKEILEVREAGLKILKKYKGAKLYSNLTSDEMKGKKKIMQDKKHVYTPADKGRVMVAMNIEDYERKMKDVLTDLKAEPSIRAGKDWDLTDKVCRDIRPIIKDMEEKGEIDKIKAKHLQPTECHAPRLTGYPKIHKPEIPMRGVVSTVGSPYDQVSKLLFPILRELQGRSGMFVKNSRELKQKVQQWRVERNEILVSYDVKNLYPSIPIAEALELVDNLLRSKPDLSEVTNLSIQSIMKLLRWTFELFYCEYGGTHYVLNSGPIGLGATGELAIIYMEEFQLECLKLPYSCLRQWYWYVDDSELKCQKTEAHAILNDINDIKEGVIVFTMEEQQNDTLPVLDLKQTVDRRSKKIEFDVHYKPTHTNINVNARSNHPEVMKKGIIKGFAERARALCDEQHLSKEMQNLEDIFVANGYHREEVREILDEKGKDRTPGEEETKALGHMVIPYVAGLAEEYKRMAKSRGFKVYFSPGSKIRSVRTLSQTPLGRKRNNAVYQIPCGCAEAGYTGETKRRVETRVGEHQAIVRLTQADLESGNLESAEHRMGKDDGGLAKHDTECPNQIDWDHCRVVGMERDTRQRKVLEGIESLRSQHEGKTVLNNHDQLYSWRGLLNEYFKEDEPPDRQ